MNPSHTIFRYVVGIFFILSVMFLDTAGWMKWFRGIIETLVKPELRMLDAANHGVTSLSQVVQFSFTGRNELVALKKELAVREQHLLIEERQRKENEILRSVLGATSTLSPLRLIPARVISKGTVAVIENAGFSIGQPVVDSQGSLVGSIERVGTWIARVRLLTDAHTLIGVSILLADGSRVPSELHGAFGASMTVEKIPGDIQLSKGDIVVTRDETDLVPPDLVIGRIGSSIDRRDAAVYQSAGVDPAVDISSLDMVMVVQ